MIDEQPKIVMLSPDVINMIAAGEVIHQPINVVKELFENALDADATKIEINLENGGFSLIQIIDNGCGISRQDLPNVCLRHSTSKIHQFIDLTTKLSTFGFRGEALFSMSCVSHLSITTKTENSDVALIAHYENGQMIGEPELTASVNGTIVEVRDIFYNKPEKIRAIPDSSSQNRQVLQMATQYSIAYPQVSIVVNIDGKERLHTIGNTTTESVLALIYGLTVDTAFFKVDAELGYKTTAQLFLGTIASTRMMKGSAIFVNNRLVRCEKVKRAMEMVYSEFLKKGDKPFFVVMLSIPPRFVDVNVHPTKRDVNFENSHLIIERLSNIVRDHLSERISGKTFKQKTKTEQMSFENSISFRPTKTPDKKKDGIEMQIKGSIQSSIITAPSFSADSSALSSQKQDDEEIDEAESQPIQITRPKSRRSIFEELKFTGFGSSNNTSIKIENEPENANDEFITTTTIGSNSYFKKRSQKIDEIPSSSQSNDQYFIDQEEPSVSTQNFQAEEEEEKESDSIFEDSESDQEKSTNESQKQRKFGLNLQPLSQNPPKPSLDSTQLSQPIRTNEISSFNFFSQKTTKNRSKSNSLFDDLKYEPSSSKLTRGDPRERTIEQMFSLSEALNSKDKKEDGDEDNENDDNEYPQFREIQIESIQELRDRERNEVNKELCSLFSKCIFVGTIRLDYVFFSSDDTLYMCELFGLTRLFFYQLFLRHFGNYGRIIFRPGIDLTALISKVNFHTEDAIELLNQNAEMLNDYFRIKIKGNMLLSMPDILTGYEPSFSSLPLFFNRLATEVNWNFEYDCIVGILDELSMLYAIQGNDSENEEVLTTTLKTIANIIIPEIKTEAFLPNISLITEGILTRLKSASEMYKIFERT